RKLRAKFFLPASTHDAQDKIRQCKSAEKCSRDGIAPVALQKHRRYRGTHGCDRYENDQPREPDRETGLQNEAVERNQRQAIIAASRQAALTPKFDQHPLAIRL